METMLHYGVKITRADGDCFWAVDGPGSSMLATSMEEAGWWNEIDIPAEVVTWWKRYFNGHTVQVEIVRSTTTFDVVHGFQTIDITEVGHG